MSHARFKAGPSLLGAAIVALSTAFSQAGDLSLIEEIIIPDASFSWGWSDTQDNQEQASSDGLSQTALGRVLSRNTINTGPQRTVVSLVGDLGMVIDYSSGLPRVGGLSLSPHEDVRVEASGGVGSSFGDVRGQVSIHFKF